MNCSNHSRKCVEEMRTESEFRLYVEIDINDITSMLKVKSGKSLQTKPIRQRLFLYSLCDLVP